MGIYLNPGKQNFLMSVNSEIFVDKTEMILYLNTVVNTQQRFVSVSRPRRFGKTMAADMVCAYYGMGAESRELFSALKLASCDGAAGSHAALSHFGQAWDHYLGRFDVIRIVMTDFIGDSEDVSGMTDYLTEEVTAELTEAYPEINYGTRISLRSVMSKIYDSTQRQFVVVIDEWDAVFRIWKKDTEGQARYLEFLRDWLKDKPYIALAYMTGILPIKKYGEQSALNMFDEYSMIRPMQLARSMGFMEEEVKGLCAEYGRDFNKIKDWYDGYILSDIVPPVNLKESQPDILEDKNSIQYSLYSPLSVVNAVRTGHIMNYWNKTETYEALADYIRRDYDGLKEEVMLLMDGSRVRIDLSTYQNDMTTFTGKDDVLALLIHLGYLGYDSANGEVFIPNNEIMDEFKASTKGTEWIDTFEAFRVSQELLEATWSCDEEKVAELVEKAHNRTANKTYNSEAALSYGIQLAYYAAQKYYTTILELDSGKGYADIVYIPGPGYTEKPVLLIELKYNMSTGGAIEQIERQEYPDRLWHYRGNILLIGINYDRDIPNDSPEFKHHSCSIKRA